MNGKFGILLRLLLAVYFTALFAVVLPAHRHDDCDNHDHCALCLAAGQSFAPSAAFIAVFVTILLFIIPILPQSAIVLSAPVVYPTRGPPPARHS